MKFKKTNLFGASKVNKVIEYLTLSDVVLCAAWGLFSPFLPVFVVDEIKDGSLAVAGFATTVFLISKSILQVPVARYIDAKKGEIDDYWFMFVGTILVSLTAFLYIFAELSWHIYLIQAISGIGAAFSTSAWNAIFSRHLDKNSEALEWSFYDTSVAISTAITASLGGLFILQFGYEVMFLIIGVFSFVGSIFILGIRSTLIKT